MSIGYFGKSLSDLVDLELIQAHADLKFAEERREQAKSHPKFNDPKKKLFLPPPNENFKILKDAIDIELKKRDIKL